MSSIWKRWLRQCLTGSALLGLMLLVSALLMLGKAGQVTVDLQNDSALLASSTLRESMRQAQSIGVAVPSVVSSEELSRLVASHDGISRMQVMLSNRHVVAASGIPMDLNRMISPTQWGALDASEHPITWTTGAERCVAVSVHNSFSQVFAYVLTCYDTQTISQLQQRIAKQLLDRGILIGLGLSLVLAGILYVLGRVDRWRHAAACMLLLGMAGMVGLSVSVFDDIKGSIRPVLDQRVVALLQSEFELLSKAQSLGFSVESIPQLQARFEALVASKKELGDLRIVKRPSRIIADAHRVTDLAPLDADPQVKRLALGVDYELLGRANPAIASDLIAQLLLDFVTLGVVMTFLMLELARLKRPAGQSVGVGSDSASAGAVVRVALFMFFLSEELIRPHVPLFAQSLPTDVVFDAVFDLIPGWGGASPGADGKVAAGLSVSVFMVVVALLQPVLSRLKAPKHWLAVIVMGCGVVTLAQALVLVADSLTPFLGSRLLAGIGYAMVFACGQAALLHIYGARQRAMAFAGLVGAIMAATVVGPPIGGLLADNLGVHAAFMAAAVMPLVGWGVLSLFKASIARGMASSVQEPNATGMPAVPVSRLASPGDAYTRPETGTKTPWRFVYLCVWAAVPAKMLLTGVLFFLLPLWLASQGAASADTGRVLLVYGVLMLLVTPIVARHSHSFARRVLWVTAGLLVSSTVAVWPWVLSHVGPALPWTGGSVLMALGVALSMGLGQSISISSQSSLVKDVSAARTPAQELLQLGTYRLIERIGNAAGPMFAAALLQHISVTQAIEWFGMGILCCAVLFFVGMKAHHRRVQKALA